jgi:hypothetical protein
MSGSTCRKCGCTLGGGGGSILIRADRETFKTEVDPQTGETKRVKAQLNHYTDAHGNRISTFEELSCPVYLGDPGSAAATAKEHVRRVKKRLDGVEDQVDGVEGRVESIEDRLARLEAENELLRAEVARKPVVDARDLMEFLVEMAKTAVASRQLEAVSMRGGERRVPRQLVDVIDAVSVPAEERERVLVRSHEAEDE